MMKPGLLPPLSKFIGRGLAVCVILIPGIDE